MFYNLLSIIHLLNCIKLSDFQGTEISLTNSHTWFESGSGAVISLYWDSGSAEALPHLFVCQP